MSEYSENNISAIWADIKEYVSIQKEYCKLEVIEKLSLIVSFLLITLFCIGFLFLALVYCSLALLFLLESAFGSIIPALFLVGAANVLIMLLLLAFRKHLFINPVVRLVDKLFK